MGACWVRSAGSAKRPRGFVTAVLFLSGLSGLQPAAAQTPEAQALYSQGVQALNERRFDDARAALTQAVGADPDFAGAWMDLAVATFGAGDTVQAEEFLNILESRFTLPDPMAQAVAGLRSRMYAQTTAAFPSPWTWRKSVQVGAGLDSNANGGLALNDLTLTLPGGGVVLPISPSLQPRSDRFATAGVSGQGVRVDGPNQLEFVASLKGRANSRTTDFDTLDLQGGVGWSSSTPLPGVAGKVLPGPWRAGFAVQHLRLAGNALLNSAVLSGLHAWPSIDCAPQASLEIDWRNFPIAANLNSRTTWFGGSAGCPGLFPASGGRWNAQLRIGFESARSAFLSTNGRPGGDTRHIELTLSHVWNWGDGASSRKLEAQAQWARAQDTEGYSPLLASNARRQVRRSTVGLSYTVPLSILALDRSWTGSVALQGFRQASNLEVFRLSGRLAQLSVQKAW